VLIGDQVLTILSEPSNGALPVSEVQPFALPPNLDDQRPDAHPPATLKGDNIMLLIILVVLLLLFGFGGYRMGPGIGYYGGGGISLILLIVIILILARVI
jgi:hypothetical protein